MNHREALQALLDGKKLCRQGWQPGDYLTLSAEGTIVDHIGSKAASYFNVPKSDWEIYEEPKQPRTVKYAPAIYRNSQGALCRTIELYTLEEEAAAIRDFAAIPGWSFIQFDWALAVEITE